jgi:crotonobetainyl-CoA:carnitine CoA-transferase CaiB-like acyl-CoA transferase
MHEELNTYAGFLASPQVAATGAVSWVEHPGVAGKLPLPNVIGAPPYAQGAHAPALGADTEAVLAAHGFTAEEIAAIHPEGAGYTLLRRSGT